MHLDDPSPPPAVSSPSRVRTNWRADSGVTSSACGGAAAILRDLKKLIVDCAEICGISDENRDYICRCRRSSPEPHISAILLPAVSKAKRISSCGRILRRKIQPRTRSRRGCAKSEGRHHSLEKKRAEIFITCKSSARPKVKSHAVTIYSRKHKWRPRSREAHVFDSSCVAPCRVRDFGSGICPCKLCRGIFCWSDQPVDYFGK